MRRLPAWPVAAKFGAISALTAAGCGGDARVELSAADALQAIAVQMEMTVKEYHGEVSRYDDAREAAVVTAFVERVRRDVNDQVTVDGHAADFAKALARIRTDRETEWSRRAAAMENVAVLLEVSRGLQKLAISSLSLRDELQRYLEGWMAARGDAAKGSGAGMAVQTASPAN